MESHCVQSGIGVKWRWRYKTRTPVLIVSQCSYYKCCMDHELLEGTYQFSLIPTAAALCTTPDFTLLSNEKSNNTKNRRAYCQLSSPANSFPNKANVFVFSFYIQTRQLHRPPQVLTLNWFHMIQ